MTIVKRLRLLTAALGVAAASVAVVTTVFGDIRPNPTPATPTRTEAAVDTAARTRYTDQPALTYQTGANEVAFAWQVKATLPAAAARPRDILVMVDTSASQAGVHLARARTILAGLAKDAGADDRIDLWTININNGAATRSLTGGFLPANGNEVATAAAKLANAEYGAGAVDLKAGLEKAVAAFERRPGRNQVLLYLGDGESAASPVEISEPTRVEIGNTLADREVAFFAVPLGVRTNGHNLHGLAAMTGGAVVRPQDDLVGPNARKEFTAKLTASFDVPVLRPDRVTFGPEVAEVYPTRLPPLRGDRPTLVVGKLKAPAAAVTARVEGRTAGGKVAFDLRETLPAPAVENYFVNAMIAQWKEAAAKDAPALLAADRTLAMASEQYRMFRDEFNLQAVWAITSDRLDHAEKLFEAAAKIDPASEDAKTGLRVVARVRNGELKSEKVKVRMSGGAKIGPGLTDLARAPAEAGGPATGATGGAQPAGPGAAERDLIGQARAAQAVIEQESRTLVDETLRRSRRLMNVDPDTAYEELKRQRDSVLANDQLSDTVRRRLIQDLDSTMTEIQLKGAQIKRELAAQRERISQARQRISEYERQASQERETQARIDAFKELMAQARFELAQQEAQVMIQERIARGQTIPPEAHAAYRIGQSATNLREHRELKRIREDRYLLTMMQAEKSFIPYPDEPPVHFPPASVWRELTGKRTELYGTMSLGAGAPPGFKRLRSLLEGETDNRVRIKNLSALSLDALLSQLTSDFQEYGVRFVYRTDMFPPDFKPGDQKLNKSVNDLSGLPLGAFLDTILRDYDMSWIARPEYIEIGPNLVTSSLRYQEKVTRVFDVAELIIGIPQSVNPQTLYSSIQFQGQFLTIFGSSFVPQFGINGNGFQFQGGGFGGQFQGGGFGAGGGFPAGGGGGFPAGGGGAPPGGGFGGAGGGFPIGGAGGGGQMQGAGFSGVQGGLAGQFGIQGNDQSQFLVQLIVSVVARGEWDLQFVGGAQQPLFNQDVLAQAQTVVDAKDLNSLGFYPPARALVVRGSHRYHLSPSFKLKRSDAAMGAGGPGLPGRNPVAAAPAGGAAPGAVGNGNTDTKVAAKLDPKSRVMEFAKANGQDPDKLWNATFEKAITDPDLVIDAAEILFEMKEYAHATEALKAALRKGRTASGWAHDALAISLQAGQAAPAEVERASLSAIDLDPSDPKAYLRAARAESDLGHHEVALAFCQRASYLEPNMPTPYANALVYAEKATDVKSDVVNWASTNLLRRDWPADGLDYHVAAKSSVEKIAKKMATSGRQDEADKLSASVGNEKTRDIVVELLWQGAMSDLDLYVTEPSGAVCSATQKKTTGGGVMKSDILEQDGDRAEVYTASQAFPGTYTLNVRTALGKAIGGRATIRVTKHGGTDQKSVEVYSVDLASPKPISVQLDTGSRTELALVTVETTATQLETTRATSTGATAGLGSATGATERATMPLVTQTLEGRVQNISAGLPGLRFETKMSADRQAMVVAANPVFTGPAKDIPLPKTSLLPGGGR